MIFKTASDSPQPRKLFFSLPTDRKFQFISLLSDLEFE